jgi:hypothetical protein
MSLFRLLLTLTVLFVIVGELLTHLPAWSKTILACGWAAVLVAAAVDGWRQTRRERAARAERERLQLHRS